MSNSEETFSPEYDEFNITNSKSISKEMEEKFPEMEIEYEKYEIGKPIRIVIRAQIIHDKN